MKMNSSGKVLTVFLIVIGVLLTSLTALSMFFWKEEIKKREKAEGQFEESQTMVVKLEDSMKELKKQNFLLEEKNKEVDVRINSLLDELDLEEGLREELKIEISTLKTQLETANKERLDTREKSASQLKSVEDKVAQLETQIQEQLSANTQLKGLNDQLNQEISKLKEQVDSGLSSDFTQEPVDQTADADVELEPIVVRAKNALKNTFKVGKKDGGKILTVDEDTEFVIVSLGANDGINQGDMMSVYRSGEYLGDVKITRVQPEMSAADFVPPFSSESVKENDQVILKQ